MKEFRELREKLIDDNFHTDAKILECLEAGRYDLVIELSKIAMQHEEQGYITKEQQDYRDIEIYKNIKGA